MSIKAAEKALRLAEVPGELHEQALDCLQEARRRAKGLTLHQLRARLAAKRIAQALPWSAETVEDALPAYASFGVAPSGGNGVNGDNVPWAEHYQMPDGSIRQVWMLGKPRGGELPPGLRERAKADVDARRAAVMAAGGQWFKAAPCTLPLELDTSPESLDYQCACARNYWGHRFFSGGAGKHPRSVEARTAWLRSNGGEREAWSRGQPVDGGIQQWTGQRSRWTAQVLKQGDVWQVNLQMRLAGRWQIGWRLGYEIDNARNAHPRPGFDKRACLTWSMRPERSKT